MAKGGIVRFTPDNAASVCALAACLLAFVCPESPVSFWLAMAALPFMVWEIIQNPHRIFYVIGFMVLGLVLLLLEWPFPPQTGVIWIPIAVLSLQLRLGLLVIAERRRKTNCDFAAELKSMLPENCLLFIDNDIETQTATADLHADHIVRVQMGETLPADGIVSFGSGFTEELPLTGDPEPAAKGVGKFVFAGSKNKNSSFLFRVANAGSATFLLKKAEFLRKGFAEVPLIKMRYFLVEILALASILALHIALQESNSALMGIWLSSLGAVYGGASWALGLAMCSRSAAMGIIWKSTADIKAIGNAATVVTDPEGSVMEGTLRLSGVATDDAMAEEGALRLAAPLARRIETPAAYSLLKELRIRNIPLELLDSYSPAPGGGSGLVSGEEVRLCDEAAALAEQIPFGKFSSFLTQEMNRAGASAIFLLKDGQAVAAFTFVDTIRASSPDAVLALKRAGLSLILVSPARKESVEALAEEVGAEHFYGEARPAATEELMKRLARDGLNPVWLDNGLVPLPSGAFPKIVMPLIKIHGEAVSARWDLAGAWQVIRVARTFLAYARKQFLFTVILQLIFVGLSMRWPLAAVAASMLAAPILFITVNKLAQEPLA